MILAKVVISPKGVQQVDIETPMERHQEAEDFYIWLKPLLNRLNTAIGERENLSSGEVVKIFKARPGLIFTFSNDLDSIEDIAVRADIKEQEDLLLQMARDIKSEFSRHRGVDGVEEKSVGK
jgi:hypothetical protein